MIRRITKTLGALSFLSISFALLNGSSAGAVTFYAPDGPDSHYEADNGALGGESAVHLVVSNGDGSSLDAPQSTVIIYSRTPNPQVIINNYNHCYNPGLGTIDSNSPSTRSGSDTSFLLYDGGDPNGFSVISASLNNIEPESGNCERSLTLNPNITLRGPAASGLNGYYVTRLVTTMYIENGTNAFSVEVRDQGGNPNGYVSYTNQDNSKFAIQKRPPNGAERTEFELKFAVPCDADLANQPALSWYDADRGQGNQTGDIYFELRSRARGSGGAYDQVDVSAYRDVGGNGDYGSLGFTFQKDREYDWIWHHVDAGNGVQFGIPYNSIFSTVTCIAYDLTPTLTTDVGGVVEPGTTVNALPKVDNAGPTGSNATDWRVTRFTLTSGQGVPNSSGGTSSSDPCGYFAPSSGCASSDSGNRTFGVGNTNLSTVADEVADLAVGAQICYALSVQPYSHQTTDWRHSAPVCVKIGKRPKVQIWGSDVISRGSVRTSTTTKRVGAGISTFGSWGEYGIFSLGSNNAAASGSGLVGGSPSASQDSWSALTFANNGVAPLKFGYFGASSALPPRPAVATYFLNRASTPLAPGTISLTGQSGVLRYNGGANIIINASTIAASHSVVIVAPNANVVIAGNIDYANGPFTDVGQIPQVVIIATNVWIQGNVTNVDSWLVSGNGVITCNDVGVGAPLSANVCNNPLTINGPVISPSIYLRRTAGSGPGASSDDPAERINLRADAYLWAKTQTGTNDTATTVFSYEVPPRF